ncbi:MAG: hypothetical protein SPJ17_07720 [Anaeroplasma sp.]|uniref:hypothetical protein n=1 Tax=Anaeroplasma sp. TaxID=1872523 RepID=UPI002A91CD79|nr:hypothetical protein [Anaeroplasma sp.]MDY5983572.1 hypothetical protein [Anaeroplasma sp.]
MKFLKSIFLKLKAKKTLKTYQKPLLVTLLTLLLINFIILAIAAIIAFAIDNNNYNGALFGGNFAAAFVTAVKWMIAPNSILSYDTDKLSIMVLAAVVIVIEMVLFSGAIVAMVTTSLRSFIDKKSKAKGKIILSNHFIILNWNSKVPDIIFNLMLKGFKNNIVILSNQTKEYIESEIKSLFLANDVTQKYKANLIIKEGDPLLRGNLDDISIEKASQIVVMAREDMSDGDDDNILNQDLLNLKIVLRIGSFEIPSNTQIVVETDSDETRQQIENISYTVSSLKGKSIIPVSFNRKIGQIIAQSIVSPEMAEVYLELFSFQGAEFYSIDSKETVEEYMNTHDNSIPVVKLNKLFVLADDEKECLKRREGAISSIVPLKPVVIRPYKNCNIFVIGDNKKSEFILDNLNRSAESDEFNYQIKHYHKNENDLLIKDIKETEGEKKVLILSDDNVSEESYDANVFVTLIELSKAFPKRENLTLITELLDSRNLSSVRDFDIHNTIISNKMMSILITQLAMNLDSKKFYHKLLTTDHAGDANDFDIQITLAKDLIEMDKEFIFKSKGELLHSFYKCFNGKNILIGICMNDDVFFLNSNQDKEEEIKVSSKDSFIYVKF